jgi:hypothetical protein
MVTKSLSVMLTVVSPLCMAWCWECGDDDEMLPSVW